MRKNLHIHFFFFYLAGSRVSTQNSTRKDDISKISKIAQHVQKGKKGFKKTNHEIKILSF